MMDITSKLCVSFFVVALFFASAQAQDKAVQISLVNPVQLFSESTSVTGLRINLLYGKNTNVNGLDWGLVNHTTSGTSFGLQTGFLNLDEANFSGHQNGFVNVIKGNMSGMQWGVINYGESVSGIQIGVINYAQYLKKGLQIGLVNIAKQNGQFPIFPIINWAM
ncbi:MAG: hypothetical protein LWX56_03485 [Ignavibacteria bacterium]|nr:hypothetical protein [Ignavibacteria bacterium]